MARLGILAFLFELPTPEAENMSCFAFDGSMLRCGSVHIGLVGIDAPKSQTIAGQFAAGRSVSGSTICMLNG